MFAPSLVGAVALGGGATSNVAAPLVGAVGWGAVGVGVRGRVPWGWYQGRGVVARSPWKAAPATLFDSTQVQSQLTSRHCREKEYPLQSDSELFLSKLLLIFYGMEEGEHLREMLFYQLL